MSEKSPAEKLAEKKAAAKKPSMGRKVVFDKVLLQDLRTVLGLSLRDVERATGVSNCSILDAERGSELSLSSALKLAQFYGKSVEEIWPT